MDGILNVHKPSGPTSHDIVDKVRRLTGTKRVGHAGTLDPLASGVLVVFVGKATRMIEYMPGEPKVYTTGLQLGRVTDTADITGETLSECATGDVTEEALKQAMRGFKGVIEQIPPMHSAIKLGGKKLYELAREGKTVERKPRRVTIFDIGLASFTAGDAAEAVLTVSCSSGTYIRTLCEDIGGVLGVGGCMSSLVRNRVGYFGLSEAYLPEQLAELAASERLREVMLPVDAALADMDAVECNEEQSSKLRRGNPIDYNGMVPPGVLVRLIGPGGELNGVGVILKENSRTIVKPEKILV